MNRRLVQGFTLLEVLLSVIICTFISLTVYQAITATVKGSSIVNKKLRGINKLQTAVNMIEQHVSHALISSKLQKDDLRNNGMQVSKLLLDSDDYGIYFLCDISNGIFYNIQPIRLGYRLKNGVLEKLSYDFDNDEFKKYKVMDGVTAFIIRVYYKRTWLSKWNEPSILPNGVEITIELEGIGSVRKVIPLLNNNF